MALPVISRLKPYASAHMPGMLLYRAFLTALMLFMLISLSFASSSRITPPSESGVLSYAAEGAREDYTDVLRLLSEQTALACEAMPQLSEGSSGSTVLLLQRRLNELGYLATEPTGVFGAGTAAAVRALEADNSLKVDGIVTAGVYAVLAGSY